MTRIIESDEEFRSLFDVIGKGKVLRIIIVVILLYVVGVFLTMVLFFSSFIGRFQDWGISINSGFYVQNIIKNFPREIHQYSDLEKIILSYPFFWLIYILTPSYGYKVYDNSNLLFGGMLHPSFWFYVIIMVFITWFVLLKDRLRTTSIITLVVPFIIFYLICLSLFLLSIYIIYQVSSYSMVYYLDLFMKNESNNLLFFMYFISLSVFVVTVLIFVIMIKYGLIFIERWKNIEE